MSYIFTSDNPIPSTLKDYILSFIAPEVRVDNGELERIFNMSNNHVCKITINKQSNGYVDITVRNTLMSGRVEASLSELKIQTRTINGMFDGKYVMNRRYIPSEEIDRVSEDILSYKHGVPNGHHLYTHFDNTRGYPIQRVHNYVNGQLVD